MASALFPAEMITFACFWAAAEKEQSKSATSREATRAPGSEGCDPFRESGFRPRRRLLSPEVESLKVKSLKVKSLEVESLKVKSLKVRGRKIKGPKSRDPKFRSSEDLAAGGSRRRVAG
jgi:hypothetical protein